MAAELRKVSRKSVRGLLGHRGLICEGGREATVPTRGTRPCSWGGPPRGLLAPWLFSPKNLFSDFDRIFRELLNPAQKKDTKCNSAENSVSSD